MPTATDTPTHTAAVKGRISTATRSQVRNPVTAMASTFEKSQPRSSKPQKSLPVTGIATIPMNSASSHQVQNVHTSPPRRYAESTVRSTAAVSSGNNSLIFFFIFFLFLLYQILPRRRIKSANACLPIFMIRFMLIEFFPACLGRNVMGIYST